MYKKTIFLSTLLLLPSLVFGQNPPSSDLLVPKLPGSQVTGDLSCFDYYQFGSVQADLQSEVSQTVPGATLSFRGNIINENNYPLVDGKLYVKIFRRDEGTFSQGNGNPVVDQFVIQEKLHLDAKEVRPLSFEWKVPFNARGGDYYAGYFFITNDRYNLMGLSFTDDVLGNQSQFSITNGEPAKNVEFDKNSVFLNERKVPMAAVPLHFNAQENVTLKVRISNPSSETKAIPLQWNQYDWDSQRAENRKNTKTELVTLRPNETREVQYVPITTSGGVSYIIASLQDGEVKNFINVRYVKEGVEETRINFPGITSFPLKKGEEQTLFACAHSTNMPVVKDNILILTAKGRDGEVISQYRYTGDISGAMSGFGQKFTPERNYNYVTLEASLYRGGNEIEKVEMVYDCQVLNPDKCQGTEQSNFFENKKTLAVAGIGLMGVIILGILIFLRRRTKFIRW